MKEQTVLLLVLIILTNDYDGAITDQSTPKPYLTQQITSNQATTMITNETAISPIKITTAANITTNLTVNTTTDPNITYYRCAGPTWENELYFVILLLLVPVVFLGNFVVVVVVFSTRTLRKQPMYLFLASLAVADSLIGIFLFPLRAKLAQEGRHFKLPTFLCWLFWLCDQLINLVSILHFIFVAVDRYIALKYTYDYSNMITRKRAILIIIMIWTSSTVWVLLGIPQWTAFPPNWYPEPVYKVSIYNLPEYGCAHLNPNFSITTLVLWATLPILFLVFLYSFIYRTAIRHVNEISRLHMGNTEQIRRKKQLQLIRSIVTVFVSYAVCWIPLSVLSLWMVANQEKASRLICSGKTWFKVLKFLCLKLFSAVCPNVNPFIYVLTNAAFVTALKRLFHRVTGRELGKNDNSTFQSQTTKYSVETDDSLRMRRLSSKNATKYVTGTINKGSTTNEE